MKINSQRDKRNYLIIALCAILVVMGVGYAAFSSLLTINGTANISNSWCVGFDNTQTNAMQITKGISTGANPTGTMSYSGTACGTNLVPNSSLTATFHQPGDQIEYTLTIINKSTVTAAIKSILVDNESVTSDTTKKKDNITYIIEMPESTTLVPNASTTMKVIAKFQNETDVTGPYNGNETKTIEVKINAEQDDGNGGFTPVPVSNKYTGSIYRRNKAQARVGDSIKSGIKNIWCGLGTDPYGNTYSSCDVNQVYEFEEECRASGWSNCEQGTITTGVEEYTTDASTLNANLYFKHDVVEDIITASYVCFVYNNEEHCIKGGDGGASFAANTGIVQDFQAFYNLGNYEDVYGVRRGCRYDNSRAECYAEAMNLPFSHVIVQGNNNYVYITGDEVSYMIDNGVTK